MSFESTLQTLSGLAVTRGIHYNLDTMHQALKLLACDTKSTPYIHIAGTNGKGSTLHFIRAGLEANGYTVGTYTSPHLTCYTERFQSHQTPISKKTFMRYFQQINTACSALPLTEFEWLTLIAFLYFDETRPDFVLLETGLGGRLDATNCVTPICSVITPIAFDHQLILGNTLTKITKEKTGIIKPNIPIVTTSQQPLVTKIIRQNAADNHAPFFIANNPSFTLNEPYKNTYETQNAVLAWATLKHGISLTHPQLNQATKAIQQTTIPGRLAITRQGQQTTIKDGAHNPHAIKALMETIKTKFPGLTPTIVFGVLKTKELRTILTYLAKYTNHLYYAPFSDLAYAFSSVEIMAKKCGLTVTRYDKKSSFDTKTHPLIVFTGSIHFIGSL